MQTILIQISERSPTLEICDVLADTGKAVKIRNRDNGIECYVPWAGIRQRKPGVPTYENEYVLCQWFRDKLDARQERALGVSE